MQVVFKLTPAQALIATAIVMRAAAADAQEESEEVEKHCFWAGNLIGKVYAYAYTNTNQRLEFNPDAGTLTYTGERMPLHQDGGAAILREIAGGDFGNLRVVGYTTSDKRLRWDETLKSYILNRSSLEELVAEVAKSTILKKGWCTSVMNLSRFPEVEECVTAICRGQTERMISASFDSKTVKTARTLLKAETV